MSNKNICPDHLSAEAVPSSLRPRNSLTIIGLSIPMQEFFGGSRGYLLTMQTIAISRDDALYEAFADIARAADGTLVCTYRQSLCHGPVPFSRIVVRRSRDGGAPGARLNWWSSVPASRPPPARASSTARAWPPAPTASYCWPWT